MKKAVGACARLATVQLSFFFRKLQTDLGGQCFHPRQNLQDTVDTYSQDAGTNFMKTVLDKSYENLYEKCLIFSCLLCQKVNLTALPFL